MKRYVIVFIALLGVAAFASAAPSLSKRRPDAASRARPQVAARTRTQPRAAGRRRRAELEKNTRRFLRCRLAA